MTTNVFLTQEPILHFLNNAGQPNVGGTLLTQVGGVNYPAYQDPAGLTPLPNPIPLNSRGEISNSSGVSCQLFLTPGVAYTFTLFDVNGNQLWTANSITSLAPVAVGAMTDEKGLGGLPGFVNGVDFTAGTSNSLTLSGNYGSASNLWVEFDGVPQGADTFSIGGAGNTTLTFNAVIPVGTNKVYVKGGTALTVGIPGNQTVGDAQISTSSNLYNHVYSFVVSKDYGATGNGTTNDAANIASAGSVASSTGKLLRVTPGTYLIGSNISFAGLVEFMPGAKFTIPTGVTVEFNGGVSAPVQQIFACTGTGAVTINASITRVGYAEWWGAIPTVVVNGVIVNSPVADCSPMINACIVACPVTQLMTGIYATLNPVLQSTPERTVFGATQGLAGGSGAVGTTTIRLNDASKTIWQIGPNVLSGTVQASNVLKGVVLDRGVAPNVTAAANGLLIQWTAWTEIEDVFVFDCVYCFHFIATSTTRMNRVNAWKQTAGVGGGTNVDKFYGFWVDSSVSTGLPDSGNASLTIENASVTALALTAMAWQSTWDFQGLLASGSFGWADFWIDTFETNGLGQGIQLVGDGVTSGQALDGYKNHDVRFTNLVLDANAVYGINFGALSVYGAVQITNSYINNHPLGTAPVGIFYNHSNAAISVTGLEYVGSTNPNGIAVSAQSSSGIMHKNNTYYECGATPLQVIGCFSCSFEDRIRNNSAALGHNAVTVTGGTNNCQFRMMMDGISGAFVNGYDTDGTQTYCEFNCSGIEIGAIAGGGGKLNNNGTLITSLNAIFATSNLTSGLMT